MKLFEHTYANGLVLIAEQMDWLRSAAFSINLPAGCASDPSPRRGVANFLAEMVQRGAGERDSRQFAEALDRLGVDRHALVTSAHTSFSAATISESLLPALQIYADLVRRPHLPEGQLDDGRQVCLLEIASLQDDLAQRTMQDLKQLTYGDVWGRSAVGKEEDILQVTASDLATFHQQCYVPQQTILSVAGQFNWDELRDGVGQLFEDWQGPPPAALGDPTASIEHRHIRHESSQTQIGLAYPTVPCRHPDYFQARGVVGVLSDGMSSRLFTEIRENRGLCYTVYAVYHSLHDQARVLCYAGTSNDRAQETLDVLIAELQRVREGIEENELNRLKAKTKSALIMQQESSASRCMSIAGDWYYLGRVRSMEEIHDAIDAVSCDSIQAYTQRHPLDAFNVVTLGQQPLEINHGVS